jgi:hypothetical protein
VKPRGIFCLEDDWWNSLRESASLEPVLNLLNKWDPYYVPYIHRNAATPEALQYYLRKWCQRGYSAYPILYLAFHGSPGEFQLGFGRGGPKPVSLDWLEDELAGRCKGRIIFISSCSTLEVNGNRLNSFLKRTKALAVCGYRGVVDWLQSAVFDALVLGALQQNAMTVPGAKAMLRRINVAGCGLAKELQFRMVIKR